MENFDLMAKTYDTDIRIERARIVADKIRQHIKDGNSKSAIEYGCGTGLVGFQLSNDFKKLLLVDSSPKMVEQVEQKLMKLNNPAVSTLCADFMAITPQDLYADYIFSSLVLHHIKDTESILRRFYDILCDDGHLLIVDIDADDGSFHANHPGFDGHNGFNQSSLIALAKKAGFSKAEAGTFYNGKKAAGEKEAQYSLFILDAMK